MAFSDTVAKGNQIGMFGWNPLANIRSQEDYNKLPEGLKNVYNEALGYRSIIGDRSIIGGLNESPEERKQRLQVELDAQKQMLNFAQGLGKESVETAYKYSTLANIPKTIAQSFGNIAATNLYGAQAIVDSLAKTMGQYPRAQFSSIPYQPQKYFE